MSFIDEKDGEEFILFENHANMRLFQKRIRTNKTLFSELSFISSYLSKILDWIKTLQENLGNFNFYIFLVIASIIFFLSITKFKFIYFYFYFFSNSFLPNFGSNKQL